jgi:transcriptional regulator with XRE-family HTH domain
MSLINEPELYRKIGELVRIAREKAGWTQADLAKLSGLTRTSITNLEAGNQRIRVHTLLNIAQALGMPPSTLLPLPINEKVEAKTNVDAHLKDVDLTKTEQDWIKRVLEND